MMSGFARKVYKFLTSKNEPSTNPCICNTPLQIHLDPAQTTVVGREPSISEDDGMHHCVNLVSNKLPLMLSKQHASLTFDKEKNKWTIKDLQSLNGVYVNSKRIKVLQATPLTVSDKICFGSLVSNNELIYKLIHKDGTTLLEMCVKSIDPAEENVVPPLARASARKQPSARKIAKIDLMERSTNIPLSSTALQPSRNTSLVSAASLVKDQSKIQLQSNTEALKNEPATNNKQIGKQEQVNELRDVGGIVSSMKEEFTCVICRELFISAHTLPCSHSFCECCIKEWIKAKKVCPVCRKCSKPGPVFSLALDNAVTTLESKLTPIEKKERSAVKNEHKIKLQKLVTIGYEDSFGVGDSDSEFSDSSISTISTISTISSYDSNDSSDESLSGTSFSSFSDGTFTSEGDSDTDTSDEDYGYYKGYGRCFNCGEQGHWRAQCPYLQ